MNGLPPAVVAAARKPKTKSKPRAEVATGGFGTDSDYQQTEDVLTGRDPDEESVVKSYYGPSVPASPFNVTKFVERKLERSRQEDQAKRQPRWRQYMNPSENR